MEKRKVLFVAHHLTMGGSQKSLLTTLPLIDYNRNDVTLYIRKNRLDLLEYVDSRVKVIVNEDKTHYYRKLRSLLYLIEIKICDFLGLHHQANKYRNSLSDYIRNKMKRYELKHYFSNNEFDVAVSFFQGYSLDILVDGIKAEKKYAFYRISIDDAHDFHKNAFSKLDGIIAVSPLIGRMLATWYPEYREKILMIENYVDAEEIISKANSSIPIMTHQRPLICSCGRMSYEKGFDLAIKAAQILKSHKLCFNWVFIGDGPEKQSLVEMAQQLNLQDCIIWAGLQENPYPWIENSDFYVQPSREESFGRTIKEALILGKPIVSTATVGAEHVLKNGELGILTSIDENSLANGIRTMLTNEDVCKKYTRLYSISQYRQEKSRYVSNIQNLLEGNTHEIQCDYPRI